MIKKRQLTADEQAFERNIAAEEAANIRYLKPGDMTIFEQGGIYRLTLPSECTYIKFGAYRTFPLSRPDTFISLRAGTEEIGMIRDLGEFDDKTQNIIRELMNKRYFVPVVTRIVSTKERYGGMTWNVQTDRGSKTIITKGLHEALSEASGNRYFITDVDGNRYELNADALDEPSRAKLDKLV